MVAIEAVREHALSIILDCIPWSMIDVRRAHPTRLPSAVAPWHVFLRTDNRHCILVAFASAYVPGKSPQDFMAAIPVSEVMEAGYSITDEGYVLVDIDSDDALIPVDPELQQG